MPLTNAERHRAYRTRHRGNAAMQAELAALQERVAQLEAELAGGPLDGPVMPTGWLSGVHLALEQERAELAERLAAIEAYQPGITEKARAWVERVDRTTSVKGRSISGRGKSEAETQGSGRTSRAVAQQGFRK